MFTKSASWYCLFNRDFDVWLERYRTCCMHHVNEVSVDLIWRAATLFASNEAFLWTFLFWGVGVDLCRWVNAELDCS